MSKYSQRNSKRVTPLSATKVNCRLWNGAESTRCCHLSADPLTWLERCPGELCDFCVESLTSGCLRRSGWSWSVAVQEHCLRKPQTQPPRLGRYPSARSEPPTPRDSVRALVSAQDRGISDRAGVVARLRPAAESSIFCHIAGVASSRGSPQRGAS